MLAIVKNILVKSAVSLFVGVASSIGMKAGVAIWDKAVSNKLKEEKQPAI